MLDEMARMSCEDGLVMQLHPGVLRDHHAPTLRAHGADAGADIPLRAEFTRALRPLLDRYGTHPRFRLVLFTVDETAYSRELAPLAGFYPSVYLGAPWWFLDSPAGMLRFRRAVTDTIGFHRTAGFVDDARALCSIPARHEVARRVDCAFLAELVCEHRLSLAEAAALARDLAGDQARRVFRLDGKTDATRPRSSQFLTSIHVNLPEIAKCTRAAYACKDAGNREKNHKNAKPCVAGLRRARGLIHVALWW